MAVLMQHRFSCTALHQHERKEQKRVRETGHFEKTRKNKNYTIGTRKLRGTQLSECKAGRWSW
jgi:hypothetical protein